MHTAQRQPHSWTYGHSASGECIYVRIWQTAGAHTASHMKQMFFAVIFCACSSVLIEVYINNCDWA